MNRNLKTRKKFGDTHIMPNFFNKRRKKKECNNCKSEYGHLNEYKFYCGVLKGSKSYSAVGRNISETEYEVNQKPIEGLICDKCISRYRFKYLYYLLPLTALLIFLMLTTDILWIIVGLFIHGFILAFSSLVFKNKNDVGDELLKYSYWNKFRAQRYDSFFTRREYSKLMSGNDTADPLASVFNFLAGGVLEDIDYLKHKKAEKLFQHPTKDNRG